MVLAAEYCKIILPIDQCEVFQNRILSEDFGLAGPLTLATVLLYLCGNLKGKMNKNNPCATKVVSSARINYSVLLFC